MGCIVNLLLAVRNLIVRLLRRRPEYVWVEIWGSLPGFSHRTGLLRRRFRPSPEPPSLEEIRRRMVAAAGRGTGVLLRVGELSAGSARLDRKSVV